jgi:hypothetical protein
MGRLCKVFDFPADEEKEDKESSEGRAQFTEMELGRTPSAPDPAVDIRDLESVIESESDKGAVSPKEPPV